MSMQNIVKIANIVALAALVAVPLAASAQLPTGGVTPIAGSNLPTDANITVFITRVINILLGIAGLVAVVFLIIGGFRYITAGGNEESAESGKKTIVNAIIGIVVVILSFVIVRVISVAII